MRNKKHDNKKLWMIMLLASIVVAGVSAQSINMPEITNNLSSIEFSLDTKSLNLPQNNLQNDYTNYTLGNSIIIINSTIEAISNHDIIYYCDIYLNNIITNNTWAYNDSGILQEEINVSMPLDIENIGINESNNQSNNQSNATNQSDSTWDGTYILTLDCNYLIESNITSTNATTIINITGNNTINETSVNVTGILANNSINISTVHELELDTQIPSITIYSPKGNHNSTANTESILFNYTVNEEALCYMYMDAMVYENVSTEFVLDTLPGYHEYTIACTDLATNEANASGNFTIEKIEAPLFFGLAINKNSFNLGEIGKYTINASDGSNVSITICPLAEGWVECWVTPEFREEDYPITQNMPYSNKTGTYIIEGVMHYKNNTLKRNLTYAVVNTLTAKIDASDRKASKNTVITFNATASGGIGSYIFNWLMHDGTKFTGPGAYKNYTQAGRYDIRLFVNDSQDNTYNTSIEVTIKDTYRLTVIITDAAQGKRLSGVWVGVNNFNATTNNNGEASFILNEGRYDVYASKDNYGAVVEDIDLDENSTLYINMTFEDFDSPKITLLTANDSVFVADNVKLKFKAEDTTTVRCELYISEGNSSWFEMKDYGDNLFVNTEYTFELSFDPGIYRWRIDCMDKNGNRAYSDEYYFLASDKDTVNTLARNYASSDEINDALDKIYGLSGEAGEIAELLGVKSRIKELYERSASLDRDIHNLAFRRDLDEKGRKEAEQEYINRIEKLRNTIPIDVKITNSKTYVKYARDEDLKILLDEYMAIKGLKLNSKAFLESTKRIQSKTTISTRVKNVVIYFMDGSTQDMTFITKDIKIPKSEDQNELTASTTMSFLEVVPKEIANDARQLNILNKEYAVIKNDPIVEFPVLVGRIEYYINDTLAIEDTQRIDTVLVDKRIKPAPATGFASIGDIAEVTSDGKFMLIAVIVLLGLAYMFINFDILGKIKNLNPATKTRVSYIRVLVNDSEDYLKEGEYDKAALVYREIKLNYESSNEKIRKQVFDECYNLCNRLDAQYFHDLEQELEAAAKAENEQKVIELYDILERTYSKIGDEYRNALKDEIHKANDLLEGLRNKQQHE